MIDVELKNLVKKFNQVVAVDNVNIEIREKEFIILVGPSGCGKTTVLRMIAGLEDVTEGEIYIGGRLVNDIEPKDRDIAMVFQNYALYPHMSVYSNMSFGLKMRKIPKNEIRERVTNAARILNIDQLLDRKPRELSGGQQQRVALGRAIVREPQVFLFDEPLSNLDAKLRVQMRSELVKLSNQLNATIIYVTHDQLEAMSMGDRIVVMKDGSIQQVGIPLDVYENPVNTFVAGFIGSPTMNFFTGRLIFENRQLYMSFSGINLALPKNMTIAYQEFAGQEMIFGIRPENILDYIQTNHGSDSGYQHFEKVQAKVEVYEHLGNGVSLVLSRNDIEFKA
ncbi:MAG TPA: sn-glycerol-3-phosphate ABC transporter ATP-binding protein UgpC, partial [Desulfobacterales bacterium]|nr:sn-glycerol-3-phosphate ABC transporter ATP-binding protein UgpC [Desulfobacterales bacterium]